MVDRHQSQILPLRELMEWPSPLCCQRALIGLPAHHACDLSPAHAVQGSSLLRAHAWDSWLFLHTVLGEVLADAGITQVLDLGSGHNGYLYDSIPAVDVIRIEEDPVAHPFSPAERVVAGDWIHPELVLSDPMLRSAIDLSEPVALVAGAVLPMITDDSPRPLQHILDNYRRLVAPGSLLALVHLTGDFAPVPMDVAAGALSRRDMPTRLRSRAEVAHLLEGWDLKPPGIAPLPSLLPFSRRHAPSAAYVAFATRPSAPVNRGRR